MTIILAVFGFMSVGSSLGRIAAGGGAAVVVSNDELREDASHELREDGSLELRE